jgi:co-chaperonin GroES (HSP10)
MIQPTKNNVVLEKIKIPPRMNNGILLPDESHRSNDYTVIAVGPDTKDLIPGMSVICLRDAGELVPYANSVYRITKEQNILAINE